MRKSKLAVLAVTASFMLTGLTAFNPAAANCDGCLAGDKNAIWQQTEIPVCWESLDTDAHDRQVTQDAITESWQANSGLTFTGWGQCGADDLGIRIAVDDSFWPKVLNFGAYLDGFPDGVNLNFNLGQRSGFSNCAAPDKRDYCNKVAAVHEFGHALGFHHEQNRSDRPTQFSCINERYQGGIPNEQLWGEFDMASVMNYCNPKWAGDGSLSEGDISGLAIVYPK